MKDKTKKIQDFISKFSKDLEHYGKDKMLNEIIPFHKAALAYDPLNKKKYSVIIEKQSENKLNFYLTSDGVKQEISKEDLAYTMDLFDSYGNIINVMWLSL